VTARDDPTEVGGALVAKDVDVVTETVVRRPVEEVASYAGDPTNAPEWYAKITSVEWRTPPPGHGDAAGQQQGPRPPRGAPRAELLR
jgi:hypothetical protein